MLLDRKQSSLLVVDIQERLLPAMDDPRSVIENTEVLLEAAGHLAIPVRVSEQYPKGLGHTAVSLQTYVDQASASIYEKVDFSCYRESSIRDSIEKSDRKQLIICGIEAHVCVLQTAIEFKQAGYEAFVVVDAISSRRKQSLEAAKARLIAEGIALVTTEMVVFEWLGRAGSDEFRTVSKLIK